MWECKACGTKNYFAREIIGGSEFVEYEKDGEHIKDFALLDLKYGDVYCRECNNKGKNIQDIAYWRE